MSQINISLISPLHAVIGTHPTLIKPSYHVIPLPTSNTSSSNTSCSSPFSATAKASAKALALGPAKTSAKVLALAEAKVEPRAEAKRPKLWIKVRP